MKLRKYEKEDSKIICSWVKDSKTLFQWSADRIGKFPLQGDELNENYRDRNPETFTPMTAVDDNNNPVGHLFILIPDENEKSTVRFGFVIVSPEVRGKGNGKKMLELAIDYSKKHFNADKITLGVFENNPNAIHCYEALGFKPVSERTVKILDDDWACIDMELNLS